MRVTHVGKRYKKGDHWYECDRCKFDYLFSKLSLETQTGLWVCPKCWDPPERPYIVPRVERPVIYTSGGGTGTTTSSDDDTPVIPPIGFAGTPIGLLLALT